MTMKNTFLRTLCILWLEIASILYATNASAQTLAPIRIGSISTISSETASFESTALAAKALFDSVNASGGIQKRKIQYFIEDDKGSPEFAEIAASRLINDQKIVAMVGNASLLECSVNANVYSQSGLVSIPGLGLDRGCFNSKMIAPVNAGPNMQLALALQFANNNLKAKSLCVMRIGQPLNLKNAFDAVIKQWTLDSSAVLTMDASNIQFSEPSKPYFTKAAELNCDAIVFAGPESFSTRYALEGRKALGAGVKFIFIGSAYTEKFSQTVGALGEGIYAMSEFEPWSSRSGSLSNWRNLMYVNNISATSASQGGYVSAQIMVHVLRSIKGDITRESVTNAFKELKNFNASMLGMPFTFGASSTHHPNQAAIPMQLLAGKWRVAHHDWLKPQK